ncbi:MAG: CDP-diacylglycerol--glycerol-3-phosphate 3-phosphatidyltransferase [Ruminococcaceae bacterium]|nr:CDP-diacylglycerol--glycerol-3-phosphate 3-phosphatidyltransferase [Oscillospiraceae bacterium]
MNTPNKLTIARIILTLLFVVFRFPPFSGIFGIIGSWIAVIIYIAASITDAVDGHLARKNNQITSFGKFLDPIADKLLVTAALLAIVPHNQMYLWAAMIILTREFIVSGVRMLAATDGVVIAAGKMGKIKMVLQTIAIITLLIAFNVQNIDLWVFPTIGNVLVVIGDVVMIGAVIMTIVSGIEYVVKNAHFSKDDI